MTRNYPSRIPSPGEGPFIRTSEVPQNASLLGLAPIGVRWHAVRKRGRIVPDGNCPPGEFATTHVLINGVWHERSDET